MKRTIIITIAVCAAIAIAALVVSGVLADGEDIPPACQDLTCPAPMGTIVTIIYMPFVAQNYSTPDFGTGEVIPPPQP